MSEPVESVADQASPDLVEGLAVCPLFFGLTRGQLEALAGIAVVKDFSAGEVVLREREYGDALYLLKRGSVAVRVQIQDELGEPEVRELAIISAPEEGPLCVGGEFFGEMCLLDLEPRSATVTTLTETQLWEFNRDDLYWLFGDDKELQLRILMTTARVLSRRLGAMDRSPGECPAEPL